MPLKSLPPVEQPQLDAHGPEHPCHHRLLAQLHGLHPHGELDVLHRGGRDHPQAAPAQTEVGQAQCRQRVIPRRDGLARPLQALVDAVVGLLDGNGAGVNHDQDGHLLGVHPLPDVGVVDDPVLPDQVTVLAQGLNEALAPVLLVTSGPIPQLVNDLLRRGHGGHLLHHGLAPYQPHPDHLVPVPVPRVTDDPGRVLVRDPVPPAVPQPGLPVLRDGVGEHLHPPAEVVDLAVPQRLVLAQVLPDQLTHVLSELVGPLVLGFGVELEQVLEGLELP